jgi:drug/metabolite transporter (DMT)-like permease
MDDGRGPARPAARGIPLKAPVLANIVLLIPVLAWALPIPFMDDFFDRWDPVFASLLRYIIALPLLWVIWRLTRPKPVPLKPDWIGWWPVLKCGGIGLIGFTVTYSFALDYMHPLTAAVLSAAAPVVAAVVARVWFRQPLAEGIGLAVLLAVIGGILCTVDFEQVDGSGFSLRGGEPLLILASAFWSWYSLETQRILPGVPQLQATTLTFIAPVVFLPPLWLLLYEVGLASTAPPLAEWKGEDVGVLLWVTVGGIAIATVCWNYGVRLIGVVVATLYLNLIPLATLLTAMLLGIEPRPLQLVGGVIVLAGVVQAQLRLLKRHRLATADRKTACP